MRKPLFYGLAALAFCSGQAAAASYGIVVGIDRYQAHEAMQSQQAKFPRLAGAANDARMIEQSLRRRGVETVVLIDEQASLANFHAAWRGVLAKARPGEEIILSFAGHGGQEDDLQPLDEVEDHLDETFMFYDFDPANPERGRLSDDELHSLFAEARDYQIVFVADACHAGGALRGGFSAMASRNGAADGPFHAKPPKHSEQDFAAPLVGDLQEALPHVTYLLAAEQGKDAESIWEFPYQGEIHGALSVAFAQAYGGAANRDGNPATSRDELLEYVRYTVARLSNHTQTPDMVPRGGALPAFSAGRDAAPPPPPAYPDLPVKIEGGSPPPGVSHFQPSPGAYRLAFAVRAGRVRASIPQGDPVAEEFDAADAAAWNRLINKYRLLDALDARHNRAARPVGIRLKEGDGRHRLNGPGGRPDPLHFSFRTDAQHRYLLLFDLAGDGRAQFLYPLEKPKDAPRLPADEYPLELEVAKPLGEDDLVAVFCAGPQPDALALLRGGDPRDAPGPETLLPLLGQDCQVGVHGFFTVP